MLALIGLALLLVLVFVLIKGYVSASVAFVGLPLIAAVLCGFGLGDIAKFMQDGIQSVMKTTVLFIFSISYFSLMSEKGLFDPAINWLTKRVGTNVYLVLFAVAAASMIGHLDGSGSTTYLIVIPAFLPLCKRLHIRPISIFTVMCLIIGWENLIPWGGPTMRAATVLNMESGAYFRLLIPRMAVMAIVGFVMIFFIARSEIKNGAGKNVAAAITDETAGSKNSFNALYWFNLILTVAMLVVLFMDTAMPLFGIFIISFMIALVVNYPNEKDQRKKLKELGSNSVSMTITLLSVGIFLGVLNGSGMLDGLSDVIVGLVPSSFGPCMLIVFALFALLAFPALGTDAFYFGYMPLVISAVAPYGVAPEIAATTLSLTAFTGALSPAIAATYLALGLLDISFGDHVKYSAKYLIAASLLSVAASMIIGLIPIFG